MSVQTRSAISGPETCVRRWAGFTVYEMLITLLIVSLLIGIAVPSLRFFVVNSKLTTGTNSLVTALNLARSEAVTRVVPVAVCPSANGNNCTGTAWNQGWIVFVDENTPGTVDGADEILLISDGFSPDVDVSLTGPAFLQFQPTGSLVDECDAACLGGLQLLALGTANQAPPLWLRLLPGTTAHAAPPDSPPGQGGSIGQGVGQGQGLGQGQGVAVGPDGTPPGAAQGQGPGGAPPSFATFNLCNGGTGRTITVNSVGRVRVSDSAC